MFDWGIPSNNLERCESFIVVVVTMTILIVSRPQSGIVKRIILSARFLTGGEDFLHKRLAHRGDIPLTLFVVDSIEVFFSVDPGLIWPRQIGQRWPVPNDEICVLARLQ